MPFRFVFSLAAGVVVASALGQQLPTIRSKAFSRLPSGPKNEIFAGELLVKFRPSVAAQFVAETSAAPQQKTKLLAVQQRIGEKLHGATFSRRLRAPGWTRWKTSSLIDPNRLMMAIKNDPDVVSVQPVNRIYSLITTPNDPDYPVIETDQPMVFDLEDTGEASFRRLWHLDDTAAETAWGIYPNTWYTAVTKPRNAPLIAIIDTGADVDHPDFANAGSSNTDSAFGGQIVKSLSAQFQDGDVVPGGSYVDTNGHGTHVTGLAVAAGNNGGFDSHGVIGVGYNSRAMILRVFDDQGVGSDMDAAMAIYYAADNGADIINLSLGTTNYSQIFQDAVTYAWQKGSLVVAAGNEDGSGGGNLGPIYPAACSGALAVTANGPNFVHASDNYAGSGYYVGIAAPGGNLVTYSQTAFALQYIFSTACRQPCDLSNIAALFPPYTLEYTYLIGTSMACPIVSGAAGLFYGENNLRQGNYNNIRAFRALEASAFNSNGSAKGGWDPSQGYGALNCEGLLNESNERGASIGGAHGIIYYGGTPVPNVRVTAKPFPLTKKTYQTTSKQDGTYRFDGMPAGIYKISAAPFGSSKTRTIRVKQGSDLTGVDFWCGGFTGDETPPIIDHFKVLSTSASTITFDQFAYDTETGIDKLTLRIGRTEGGSEVLGDTEVVSETAVTTVPALPVPTSGNWYLTVTYTNGAGLTSVVSKRFGNSVSNAAFVSQTIPATMVPGQTAPVSFTFKNIGTDPWTASSGIWLSSMNSLANTTWGVSRIDLNPADTIAINASKTFSFNVTAPNTVGYIDMQFGMVNNGAPFGTPSTTYSVLVAPPLASQFVSQSVPATVSAGSSFTAQITMKNRGSRAWHHAVYQLGSKMPNNNTTWGLSRVANNGNEQIMFNQAKTYTLNCTAPTTPGTYAFKWQMVKDNVSWYGEETPTVNIVVTP